LSVGALKDATTTLKFVDFVDVVNGIIAKDIIAAFGPEGLVNVSPIVLLDCSTRLCAVVSQITSLAKDQTNEKTTTKSGASLTVATSTTDEVSRS
jgi:hypothetical protein